MLLLTLYALPSLHRHDNFVHVGLYENDVATLTQYYKPDMDALLTELAAYLIPKDLTAVHKIVEKLAARIARFERGFGDDQF